MPKGIYAQHNPDCEAYRRIYRERYASIFTGPGNTTRLSKHICICIRRTK